MFVLQATKTFTDEPIDARAKLILKWLLPDDLYKKVKDGEKLQNICVHLENMKYNGYLRLFEVDMSIVKDYMTPTSWSLFQDFQNKREKDTWICPHCSVACGKDTVRWKCMRCLFWFHPACTQPKIIKTNTETNCEITYDLCFCCLFAI